MSIWSTRHSLTIRARDQYGQNLTDQPPTIDQELGENEASIDIATSGLSDAIRFSLDIGPWGERHISAEIYITPDEARLIADALIDAASGHKRPT